jgi:hypothetical protein
MSKQLCVSDPIVQYGVEIVYNINRRQSGHSLDGLSHFDNQLDRVIFL